MFVASATFAAEILVCVGIWAILRYWPGAHRWATPLAIGFVVAMGGALLWAISLSPQDLDVLLGPVVAVMIGSALLFPWGSIAQAREVIRNSFDVQEYTPQDTQAWEEAFGRFKPLLEQ